MTDSEYQARSRKLLNRLAVLNCGITPLAMLLAIRDNPMSSTNMIGSIVAKSGCVIYKSAEKLTKAELIISKEGRLILTLKGKRILKLLEDASITEPLEPKLEMVWKE